MKLQFDANQDYQLEAIESVADLFEGQSRRLGGVAFKGGRLELAAVENRLDLSDADILANLHAIQRRHHIRPDAELLCITERIKTTEGEGECRFPNFSVEMETGTGKTYVYLRTILELDRRYGLRKFIIVVPSVAVREGVLKTLRDTQEHFRALFENPVYRFYVYDSGNLTQVRQFAQSNAVEVMVMTLDSFNKAANVIRQSRDQLQGETPIHLVQAARPVLILDEPQNMESEKSVAALAMLNPLFALRYSATHRIPYNVVYRLTPAEAYRQGLVKKIEIAEAAQTDDVNRPFIRVEDISSKKKTITAKLRIHQLQKSGTVAEKTVTVKPGDSLADKSRRREYAGYEIDEINPGGGYVQFANNEKLKIGEETGADRDDIFKAQIRQTIEQHLEKHIRLKGHGVKVLSLFFIDRVANYMGDGDKPGIIRRMFDEAFEELKKGHPDFAGLKPGDVQAAYFAQKRRKGGEVEWLESKSGETKDDAAAYDLIMKKKEALLTFPGPDDDGEARRDRQVCFIFSHSALREGWDNPNIFQICTLNQTASVMKKRQEVGRGVRLAVNQTGERVRDESVNILTVVANESYQNYIETYQDEIAFEYREEIEARYGKSIAALTSAERRKIEAEYGEGILPPPPRNAKAKKAKLRKARLLGEDFKELWGRIKHKTRYNVKIDTEALLADVMPELDKAEIRPPRITITKARVNVSDSGVFEAQQYSAVKTVVDLAGRYPLPNLVTVMEDLMQNTSPPVRLTRRTLLEVFKRAKNKQAALDNPYEWAATAVRILKDKLADHLVRGIEYEKINEQYEMTQIIDENVVELFGKYIYEPDPDNEKTIYNRMDLDSQVESDFAKELNARDDVKLFVKLPGWFVVKTPVGDYNPDWAIVMEETDKDGKPLLYLVSETKGTENINELRPAEKRKVLCGAAHFGSKQLKVKGALDGVDFSVRNTAKNLP